MKKKTILIITAAVVVALIAIVAIAVNNKHRETGEDQPNPSATVAPEPNGDAADTVVDLKNGPLTIEDDLYPFTLNCNADGTLTVTMDGDVPSGFEWEDAEFRSDEIITVSKDSEKSYKLTGKTIGSELITLPLRRIGGANETIAQIILNVEIGRNTEYEKTGEMSEAVEDETVTIPILEAVGEIDKGVTVLEFKLEKYDIPAEDEIIYRSSVSDYHSYQIKVTDDGRKYEIALDGTDKNWTISSHDISYYTVEGPNITDSRVVTVVNILPRKETEDEEDFVDESENEDEDDEDDEVKPRFMIIGIVNQELNIYFELTLFANDDGTSTVCSHGTSVYDVPMLTDEYIGVEQSEGTEE